MKTLMTFIVKLFIISTPLLGQVPDTLWSRIHDITNDIDMGRCVDQTVDGGYIVTGSCVPDGMTSFIDALLIKTDNSGMIQWTKTFDQGFFEEGCSIEQTADQGYIIGGIKLTGVYPFVKEPKSDAWLLKTDPNGDTVWTKRYGGNGNDYCTAVHQTTDMGYILTGATGTKDCGPQWEINETTEPDSGRAWLVKTDPSGQIVWTRSFQERTNGNDVIQLSNGGYLITGHIFPDPRNSQSDVLLIKTDGYGNLVWIKILGTDDYDVGFCVRETADGYIVSGQTKPIGEPYNALLIKTDLNGDVRWIKSFGSQGSDAAFTVEVAADGYYGSGSVNGNWWVTGSADMWVFKTDVNGELQWERVYDILLSDVAFSGALCSDGGYVVTGMTSYGFGGNLWLAKLGVNPAGDESPDPIADEFPRLHQNFPNPVRTETRIDFEVPGAGEVSLVIYDLTGKEAQTALDDTWFEAGRHSITVDTGNLSAGLYFYKLQTSSGQSLVQKMQVIK